MSTRRDIKMESYLKKIIILFLLCFPLIWRTNKALGLDDYQENFPIAVYERTLMDTDSEALNLIGKSGVKWICPVPFENLTSIPFPTTFWLNGVFAFSSQKM